MRILPLVAFLAVGSSCWDVYRVYQSRIRGVDGGTLHFRDVKVHFVVPEPGLRKVEDTFVCRSELQLIFYNLGSVDVVVDTRTIRILPQQILWTLGTWRALSTSKSWGEEKLVPTNLEDSHDLRIPPQERRYLYCSLEAESQSERDFEKDYLLVEIDGIRISDQVYQSGRVEFFLDTSGRPSPIW